MQVSFHRHSAGWYRMSHCFRLLSDLQLLLSEFRHLLSEFQNLCSVLLHRLLPSGNLLFLLPVYPMQKKRFLCLHSLSVHLHKADLLLQLPYWSDQKVLPESKKLLLPSVLLRHSSEKHHCSYQKILFLMSLLRCSVRLLPDLTVKLYHSMMPVQMPVGQKLH